MNGFRDRITGFTRPAFVLLTLCLAACSDLGPGGGKSDTISFANGGNKPLSIIVVELETSKRIDPNPSFKVTSNQRGLLQPGDVVSLTGQDISGGYTRGDGVTVFVYDVVDGVANYRTSIQLTSAQLKEQNFHVDVSAASSLSASAKGIWGQVLRRAPFPVVAEFSLRYALI